MKRLISVDWKKAAMMGGVAFFVAGPAYAFSDAASTVTTQVCNAYSAAKQVLITAAVLALIIGLAPMLWGQVKVKWIISALVGCVLFGLCNTIVGAFAGGGGCGGG